MVNPTQPPRTTGGDGQASEPAHRCAPRLPARRR